MSVGPSVSLLIVCYNQQHFIRKALENALTQDSVNLKVVVADDASTDGTQAIIRELAQRYPERLKPIINRILAWQGARRVRPREQ